MKSHAIRSLSAALAATLLLAAAAWAAPQVTVTISTEKEIVIEEDGRKTTQRIPAAEAVPGEVIIYTVAYTNLGSEAAANVVLDNPIPVGTTYRPISATAGEGQELTFSIDHGASYKRPTLLTYNVTLPDGRSEQRMASPEMYTHIRWRIATIPPGGTGSVTFQVTVD